MRPSIVASADSIAGVTHHLVAIRRSLALGIFTAQDVARHERLLERAVAALVAAELALALGCWVCRGGDA